MPDFDPLRRRPSGADTGPSLGAADLRRVFPHLVLIDRRRTVQALGPAWSLACPALRLGLRLGALFEVELPSGRVSLDEGLAAALPRLTLVASVGTPLRLSGQVLAHGEGLLLLLAPEAADATRAPAEGARDADGWRDAVAVLERIIENAPEGVLHFDASGRLVRCNASLERILELPRAELHGQTLAEVDAVLQGCRPAAQRQPVLAPLLARLALARPDANGRGDAAALIELVLPQRKAVLLRVRGEPLGDVVFYLSESALNGGTATTGFGSLTTQFDDSLEPLPLPQVHEIS